jgi:hypothetical protein
VGVTVFAVVLVFVAVVIVAVVIMAIVIMTIVVIGYMRIVVSRISMSKELPTLTARAVCARIQGVIVRFKGIFRIVGKTIVPLFALDPDSHILPGEPSYFRFSVFNVQFKQSVHPSLEKGFSRPGHIHADDVASLGAPKVVDEVLIFFQ